MVSGSALRYMADFVQEKKGVSGIEVFHKKVNERNLIIPNLESIDPGEEFSPGYFERVLYASSQALGDRKLLTQLGYSYGKKFSTPAMKVFSIFEKNSSIVSGIVDNLRKYLPAFPVDYTALSEKTFVIKISNIKNEEYSTFVSGYIDAVLEKVQKKIYKIEEDQNGTKKITLRFL